MRKTRLFGHAFLTGLGISCVGLSPAHAQLTGAFADAITVDTEYVTGANNATDIAFSNDGRAVITLKSGAVVIRRANGTKNMVMNAFGTVDTNSEKGLLGVVAHPTMANTFFFYVSNGTSNDDKHRVFRGTLDANDGLTVDTMNPVVAASVAGGPGLKGPANHDGGGLFIYQDQLYIGVGDTGANATPPTNKYSSCLNVGNGKVLRVNLDGTVPTDNPLVNETMVTSCDSTDGDWGTAAPDKRIYAWGFRNPWRLWVDPHTGLMWVGDVGETTREEISMGGGNQHYGYPFHEGSTDWSMNGGNLRLEKDCDQEFQPSRACTEPVYDYGHTGGANCVIGGLIPEGCGWTNAFGGKLYYLFGDHGAGWVRALEVAPDRMGVVSMTATDFGDFSGGPSSFRMGPDGALYMVMDVAGAVYRMAPTDQTGTDCMGGGGTGGAGGMSGAGGSSGAGTTGGTGMTTGGTGMTTGGTATTAGGAGGSGGSKKDSGESEDDGGCGCRTAGRHGKPIALALLGLGVAVAFGRRKRR
ncbi:MAG TPA: PQQ-dependent sugar dehydrogenase [Gemmataceae bacterium]|jgi:MYXO-CTERM domain-containing protein|nr:PQQ-dependent sugar dehydrogenase [Gemmataceae bacterium]